MFCVLLSFGLRAQDSLKIIFAGDLMGHGGQIKAALTEDGMYDYTPCFKFIAPYLQSANLAIANFELTLAGPPYKGYPQFSSPVELAEAVRDAGRRQERFHEDSPCLRFVGRTTLGHLP